MHKTLKYSLFITKLFVFGFFFLYFVEKEFLTGLLVDRITIDEELGWGERIFTEQEDELELLDDPELVAFLDRVLRPLKPVLEASDYPIQIHLSSSLQINAFAMPGAHIVVNAGLILDCEKPEELLAVVAHEIAHINRRHNLERWVYQAGIFAFLGKDRGDALPGAFVLSAMSYSRAQELEADALALEYLQSLGISPKGLQDFLLRMEHYEELQEGSQIALLLSTHPSSRERLELVAEKLGADERFYYAISFDYEGFQYLLRRRLLEDLFQEHGQSSAQ